ncbi:putative FmdB family regulatory protein [Stackebrandtia albiflava]|uniref:Putative FmdB family regulatory protein n=1 Tax=Stackebrandtia albiflava TaxID=406432 RepID=A0A562V1X8_9ACTN|nr:FmdB family zinc ribbon protein [Stackebrandtia albiflava]TWJ11807.1 putative FmdB family regulatory protein [Stackebrandtia albiflava]
MPTYQYTCSNCGHDLEARQSFTDQPLTDCPTCGENALRKQFGSVGVVFKGSGFYRTDSRSGSGKELAKNDSAKKSDTKSETKSESKKTETKKADKPAKTAAASTTG